MDSAPYAIFRGQVSGIDAVGGMVNVTMGIEGTLTLARPLPLGGATYGIHWMPQIGDWVLVAYEPGMVPQIIGPSLIESTRAGALPPTLALNPGDMALVGAGGDIVRLPASGGVAVTTVLSHTVTINGSPVVTEAALVTVRVRSLLGL